MVGEIEGKFKIAAIPNKYKDTLDDLIDSLDIGFPDHLNSSNRPRLIDKGSRNTPKSRDGLPTFLKKNCLDENILIMSLEPVLKIQNSQIHQYHKVAILDAKSRRVQYEKSQQDWEDEKGKKSKEDGKGKKNGKDREGERNRKSHQGNKVNLMVKENSDSKASVYHHIIYKY